MTLVKTIPEVKQFLRVNFLNSTASLPNMERPERRFIVPIIGQDLYDDLQEAYDAGPMEDGPLKNLLPRVQAALVPLAYWLELPFINVQITDNGLRKPVTAELQPVFKYDYNKVLSGLVDQGMEEMEELLKFLEKRSDQYPTWVESDAYKAYRKYFIKNGTEFNDTYRLCHPRRCWLAMGSIMQMVQEDYIEKSIGADFTKELRETEEPTPQEKSAIDLIKRAIAYLTIMHAVSQLTTRLTEAGFTIQVSDPDLNESSRQAAADPALERLRQEVEHIGYSYLVDLLSYLNEKASNTVFSTYYNSSFYTPPPTEPDPSLNSKLKSSFYF